MKRISLLSLLVLSSLLLGTIPTISSGVHVPLTSDATQTNTSKYLPERQLVDDVSLLLWIAPPCGDLPAGCSSELLPTFYLQQAQAQMEQVLPLLRELQKQGLVVDFVPLPEVNAVRVTAAKDALPTLETLPQVARITSVDEESVQAARQFLEERLEQAFSTVARGSAIQSTGGILATNPSVYVDDTFDEVWGYTTAGASVLATLKDSGGNTKATAAITAYSNGYYWVSFWSVGIVPGDTVYVTAAGNTVSVSVEALTARVDPVNDRVWGTAPPNRNIWVSVSTSPGCDYGEFSQWTTSNSTGNFTANLASSGNILRGDYVRVFVVDANNNGTMIARYAPIARIYNLYDSVNGYTTPYATVTAVLKNAIGGIKETQTGTASYYGYYYVYFSADMVVGDKVEVTTDGETMIVYVANLTAKVNAAANTISGIGPSPGVQLKIQACHLGLPYG